MICIINRCFYLIYSFCSSLNLSEALAKGSSVHEKKIVTLEGRLTEASVQIQHLKEQLLRSRTDCEVLKQNTWDSTQPQKEMEKAKEELSRVQEEVSNIYWNDNSSSCV